MTVFGEKMFGARSLLGKFELSKRLNRKSRHTGVFELSNVISTTGVKLLTTQFWNEAGREIRPV